MRFLTAGESHGPALTGIIEGLPAGIAIQASYIERQLKRRKQGYGRGFRQKIEDDKVEILGGVRHGRTLGSPIALLIHNKDYQNWKEIMQPEAFKGEVKKSVHVPRPGHADYFGGVKYAHTDMRNVLERASARETAMRVALGSLARRFLEELGVEITSRVCQIGSATDSTKMNAEIDKAKADGDTLGGIFEVFAEGVVIGIGSYAQWDRRLEGGVADAFMSLNAVKGVEIGDGFTLARIRGSQAHDAFFPAKQKGKIRLKTNHAGGITGGVSTGQTIVVRAAMKPIATLMNPLPSVDLRTGAPTSAHVERSDTCAVHAAAVIGESLLALVLAEAYLKKFGGDNLKEILSRVTSWSKETR